MNHRLGAIRELVKLEQALAAGRSRKSADWIEDRKAALLAELDGITGEVVDG